MEQKESFKLDMKDRRILYELDSNARQTASQIGKKIGLPTGVVNYRIKRLEEEKIITQYQIIVNLSKLGIIQFKICLAFQHLDSNHLEEILSRLKNNPSIKWIVSSRGNWDLIISLEAKSLQEIDRLKHEVLSRFGGYVSKKAISLLVEAETFNREYLLEDKQTKHSRYIMKEDKEVELDDLDLKILKNLAENARKSIVKIAEELDISERIVNYRINQLVKERVILGFKIALNYSRLGVKFYKTFIYLDSPTQEKINSLIKFLEQHRNVSHHVKVLGNWDFEPEFECYSEEEFDKTLTEIKDKFSDIIKSIDIITISKEHKFVYF